jgi:hypothetical protein
MAKKRNSPNTQAANPSKGRVKARTGTTRVSSQTDPDAVLTLIDTARASAVADVNKEVIALYWSIVPRASSLARFTCYFRSSPAQQPH